jgi:carbamoyl-phosphate synthase large subunit
MPKDPSLHKILVIGSGPIVIGQGCEFDYSGVQACKALKEEGYTVILVNSNPATIMTDPEFAHRTYIEPITPEVVEKIIEAEKPDALLPTLGGQTALNCAMELWRRGVVEGGNPFRPAGGNPCRRTEDGGRGTDFRAPGGTDFRPPVRMIGAKPEAIHKGEDRQAFKDAMIKIGLDMPRSGTAHTIEEARKVLAQIGTLPLIIRPAFTLGGSGGGIAYNKEEFEVIVARGLDLSPVSEVLIEESLLGWKEFEMEVMRDRADNCVIICSIENVDPMGVHTGDSITVAPIQTLTDREFQLMRDASFAIIREIGVETGGSNIQFAVHPETGRMIVIEMNPRVSRSSALASKATGFPIAKIAAKLAVGYTLDEVRNDITRETPASFEPTIDYVVVKCPRFTFEKFPQADPVLTTQMKSVGEAMAIGRTFKEALQKALRSLEIKRFGLIGDVPERVEKRIAVDSIDAAREALTLLRSHKTPAGEPLKRYASLIESLERFVEHRSPPNGFSFDYSSPIPSDELVRKLTIPNAERIFYVAEAFRAGFGVEEVFELTKIDRWFLQNICQVVTELERLPEDEPLFSWIAMQDSDMSLPSFQPQRASMLRAKKLGFSDRQLALTLGVKDQDLRAERNAAKILPTYRLVDTCAAEFEAYTPYYYSTYGDENERRESGKKKVIILGGGPNRIGQGIEFDYCCVHAAFALKELGFETIMVNSNPETVSTDYDTSDKLYFEPLTLEDVLNICEQERENLFGVIVQFGGQTPLNLANGLAAAGVPIIGTSPKSIEIAEDRKLFGAMLDKLGIRQTAGGTATTEEEAVTAANAVGYPVLVRPSFVLGGRGMQLVHNETDLRKYVRDAIEGSAEIRSARPTAIRAVENPPAEQTSARRADRISALQFQAFDPRGEIKMRERRLPHWQQEGATYFITFRLADAVPASVLGQWREELETWLKFQPEPWDSETAYEYQRRAFEIREEWLDAGHGECLLQRPELAQIVADTLRHFDRERYVLDAFVVMPNHVHVLVKPLPGHDLADILQSWKRFSAKTIHKRLGRTGVLWQEESWDRMVRDECDLAIKRAYIARNPEKLKADNFILSAEEVLQSVAEAQSAEEARRGAEIRSARPTAIRAVEATAAPSAAQIAAGRAEQTSALHPILVDHFLEDAVEVDVDCIADGEIVVIGAIMEHIEEAGIHSGDSSCVIPSFSLKPEVKAEITRATKAMAKELNVRGLMNVQFAVKDDVVYVLEVNPRASRTAPFVSKAIGVQLPKLAAKIMAGKTLKELGFTEEIVPKHYSVKEAVFPFIRFPGIDIMLGPEMKSTGEVMGIDRTLGLAFAKAQMAAQPALPTKGNLFISVADRQKPKIADIARGFVDLGFTIFATSGTAAALKAAKIPVKKLFKLNEGRPNALDMIKNGELAMIINTPSGKVAREDEVKIRSTATANRIPIITTLRAANASLEGIRALREHGLSVKPLQEWHA